MSRGSAPSSIVWCSRFWANRTRASSRFSYLTMMQLPVRLRLRKLNNTCLKCKLHIAELHDEVLLDLSVRSNAQLIKSLAKIIASLICFLCNVFLDVHFERPFAVEHRQNQRSMRK